MAKNKRYTVKEPLSIRIGRQVAKKGPGALESIGKFSAKLGKGIAAASLNVKEGYDKERGKC